MRPTLGFCLERRREARQTVESGVRRPWPTHRSRRRSRRFTSTPTAPLMVVDVDEVLAMFMRGFERLRRRPRAGDAHRSLRPVPEPLPPGRGHPSGRRRRAAALRRLFRERSPMRSTPRRAPPRLWRPWPTAPAIVILTNAPGGSRATAGAVAGRERLSLSIRRQRRPEGPGRSGPRGAHPRPDAFVDDLLPNLDSVEAEAPQRAPVPDGRRRAAAAVRPSAPDRHPRIDTWPDLAPAIAAALKLSSR